MFVIGLDGSALTLDELIAIACRNETVTLTDAARARVRAARDVVDEFAHRDRPTMEKCGVRRSTILPLPSSPHCAPKTTKFISG